jgi:prepilin-type N-terminal cleavage/methylation domain-containing protein
MQIDKNMISKVSDGRGFTLLELIVVLALLAILASVSVPKFIDLSANAEQKALQAGVAELNGRENLVWLNIKNSQIGWVDDAAVFHRSIRIWGQIITGAPKLKSMAACCILKIR